MATVQMTFTPLPAHVRTARLVATAVARRSGVGEPLLDEVRLAVGEACSHAVEVHREYCPDEPVRVALTGGAGRFEVVVTNVVVPEPAAVVTGVPGVTAAAAGGNGVPAGPGANGEAAHGRGGRSRSRVAPDPQQELGLAVIAGLADEVQVSRTDAGLSIRMSWPSRPA
jgi:serine/threonine-protein kinase RsbW